MGKRNRILFSVVNAVVAVEALLLVALSFTESVILLALLGIPPASLFIMWCAVAYYQIGLTKRGTYP